MPRHDLTLDLAIRKLGKAINALDANDCDSVEAVQQRFRAMRQTAQAAMGQAGDLVARLGFDCSPPEHVEL